MFAYLPRAIQCHRSYTYLHTNYPITIVLLYCLEHNAYDKTAHCFPVLNDNLCLYFLTSLDFQLTKCHIKKALSQEIKHSSGTLRHSEEKRYIKSLLMCLYLWLLCKRRVLVNRRTIDAIQKPVSEKTVDLISTTPGVHVRHACQ